MLNLYLEKTDAKYLAGRNKMSTLYGGIEAGGTKFICAVGTCPDDLIAQKRVSTTTPEETITQVIDFFQQQPRLSAVGIGSFGPIDLNPVSSTYGYITTTPKTGWSFIDLVGPIRRALDIPVAFDTDVNAAAFGEHRWGGAQGLDNFIYLTIGTGIGGGGMVNGKLMHGMVHPEMGHMIIPHDKQTDPYAGHCPYHGDCFEGLACGPALEQRWGQPGENLPTDHPAWLLEGRYLALAISNLICTLSPQRIVVGGGIMEQTQLFPIIRQDITRLLNGYVRSEEIQEHIENYIVPPKLNRQAGILGALALAIESAG